MVLLKRLVHNPLQNVFLKKILVYNNNQFLLLSYNIMDALCRHTHIDAVILVLIERIKYISLFFN
jgi:hypothetical protein